MTIPIQLPAIAIQIPHAGIAVNRFFYSNLQIFTDFGCRTSVCPEEDFSDHLLIFNKRDDMHGAVTLGTYERIDFIDFLDEPSPVFPKGLVGQFRFQQAWDLIIGISI